MPRRGELALIGAWAVAFAASAAWRFLSDDPFPLPGLRSVASGVGWSHAVQVAAVLCAALWLGIGAWHTRDRLLVFQGIAVVLFVQGFVFIGVPFGLAFGCFAGIARRRSDATRSGG